MRYSQFTPTGALDAFVEWYYILEHDPLLHSSTNINVPPHCCVALVLNYGDRLERADDGHSTKPMPPHFLTGPATRRSLLSLGGRHQILGVVLKATGASQLLGVPVREVINNHIPLDQVIGSEMDDLAEQVQEAGTHQEKIAVVEAFLLNRLKTSVLRPDWTDRALNIILSRKGAVSMDEVSTLLTVSPRQLRRRFKERFGMGPKFAARIKRFGYVNLLLSQRTDLNWQDVIHRTGYFDQAHFIKDFKQFAGEVPSEVMRRHQLREANVHAED